MAAWTIYHNPQCSKSREALSILKARGIEPQVIEYLKNPPTEQTLREIARKLSTPPSSMVRTKEDLYIQFSFDLSSTDEIVRELTKHPRLIERPIVIKDDTAIIARPVDVIEKLF